MSKTIHYFFAPHSPWAYLGHERLLKLSAQYGAMIGPKPVDPVPAALLLVAAREEQGADQALELAGAVMRAVWVEEQDIADAATLARLADDTGFDGAALVAAANEPAARQVLEGFTKEALDAGVFGSPWYVVDGQGFWGQDRLDFVERLLQV